VTGADIIVLIHESPLGVFTRDVRGVFTASETIHFIGLCLLVGALLIFDLRVLGVLKQGSLASAINYTRIAAFGLALNLVSGIVLFVSKPNNYLTNPAFQLKMGLLLLALLNVAWFSKVEHRKLLALPAGAPAPVGAKVAAGLSLLLWAGVIICGRWLPVTALEGG
jgi:hypothetical protein